MADLKSNPITPDELKQMEALHNRGLSQDEIDNEILKQRVLKQTSGDVALRVLKQVGSTLNPMNALPLLKAALVPTSKEHEAAIEGVSQFAQHPMDSLHALASSLARDPQTGQFDPGAMGESFANLLGATGLSKVAPSVNGLVKGVGKGARALATSPETQAMLGTGIGGLLGEAGGHPYVGMVAGRTLKPAIGAGATKFADLADALTRPRGPSQLEAQIGSAQYQPSKIAPVVQPRPLAPLVPSTAAPMTKTPTVSAASPESLWFGGDRTTGHFTEGPGGLSDVAAGKMTRDPLPANWEDWRTKTPNKTPQTFEDLLNSMEAVDASGPNASGESAASVEANSRSAGMKTRGEQFVVKDRAGKSRPLIGPDAVDYKPKAGEQFGVEGPDGFRLLDRGHGDWPAAWKPFLKAQ